jgi:hypothetical protein
MVEGGTGTAIGMAIQSAGIIFNCKAYYCPATLWETMAPSFPSIIEILEDMVQLALQSSASKRKQKGDDENGNLAERQNV